MVSKVLSQDNAARPLKKMNCTKHWKKYTEIIMSHIWLELMLQGVASLFSSILPDKKRWKSIRRWLLWVIQSPLTHTHVQGTITLDNYNQVLSNVSGAVRGAATSEQEQTTSNLTVVTAAFERSAQLANQVTSIPSTVSSLECTAELYSLMHAQGNLPSKPNSSGYYHKAVRTN